MRISDWSSDVCSSDLPIGKDAAAWLEAIGREIEARAAAHPRRNGDGRRRRQPFGGGGRAFTPGASACCLLERNAAVREAVRHLECPPPPAEVLHPKGRRTGTVRTRLGRARRVGR